MMITRLPRPVYSSYEWQEQGRCRSKGAEQFFLDDQDLDQRERRAQTEAARRVCASCPVRQQCLEHALRVPETFGIWGGTTPTERVHLLWDAAG
ncbi:WhiB family transcriptional regulator [Terrabacter sp. GCM10028922]|uniref:WhiB family transcriptional regulator n=1 Tax=Terrabacter sp. GCM10028922 TaxID=3273428 RepID=UPI00361CDCDA